MALSLRNSSYTVLHSAHKTHQYLQEHSIVAAKISLAKTEMNARRHLKLIKYEIERCGIVEEHYKQQEKVLTVSINDALEKEKLL